MSKVYVSYKRTVSKNYQSEAAEFGFEVEYDGAHDGMRVGRARKLCRAVVNATLGQKTGHTRGQLNAMATEFFGVRWDELMEGQAKEDEVL